MLSSNLLKIDTRKAMILTMPNLIHYLNTFIMNFVVSLFRKYGYYILTIHDCFYVEKNRGKVVKKFYFAKVKKNY